MLMTACCFLQLYQALCLQVDLVWHLVSHSMLVHLVSQLMPVLASLDDCAAVAELAAGLRYL